MMPAPKTPTLPWNKPRYLTIHAVVYKFVRDNDDLAHTTTYNSER